MILVLRRRAAGFSRRDRSLGSPPTGLKNKKRLILTCDSNAGELLTRQHATDAARVTPVTGTPASPCNIYMGENFTVRLKQWFNFISYIHDNQNGGIVHCAFGPNRNISGMSLSNDADKIRDVPNAGGSSVVSEMMSFELLQKCFKAKLLKTEMEVSYFPEGGSITDYVCEMFGTKVGVSVTRAMKYGNGHYTEKDADHLLTKKLKGVIQSSRNSMEDWQKQVLHVWSTNRDVTNTLVHAYSQLPGDVRSNTVVMITTTDHAGNFIYTNG